MDDFNAQVARNLSDAPKIEELHNLLIDIRDKAMTGAKVLHIYKPLGKETIDVINKRGFNIVDQPQISIQKDNLYYSIYW